jgi:putative nucleotidyltransferase with HDIG domain
VELSKLFRQASLKSRPFRRRLLDDKPMPRAVGIALRAGLAGGLLLLVHILFPVTAEDVSMPVREGEISEREVIAPFSFPIRRDPAELERARAEASRAVPPVLELNPQLADEAIQRLHRLARELERPPSQKAHIEELRLAVERALGVSFTRRTFEFLSSPAGPPLIAEAGRFLSELLVRPIVNPDVALSLAGHDVVNVRRGTTDFYRPAADVLPLKSAVTAAESAAQAAAPAGSPGREAFRELVLPFLKPNATYNREETSRLAALAYDKVPEMVGMVHKGERILDSHERITFEHVRKIESMEAYRREMEVGGRIGGGILAQVGRLSAVLLLITAFVLYLRLLHRHVYEDLRLLALLTTLGALFLVTAYLVTDYFHKSELLIPVAFLPVLAALLISRGVALFLAFLGPLVLVCLKGFDADFLIAGSLAGVAGVLAAQNLKRRHELYLPALLIALVNLCTVLSTGLAAREPAAVLAGRVVSGLLNAGLVGVVATFLLPILEKIFSITTNFTLIELLDRNHPLLKRMAIEAPGTFHHSMLVSELAREAAAAVGGNPLLAQVGAYYHDIGKMQMPEYFIENQTGKNRHDSLTATMSCLILGSHVRDGIQMAREARLPREIIAFIPEHHGTNLMSYFYHKALERDDNVEEQDFRYPGPRPHRKETAIVMLADSVEATARSLEDPTPGTIRTVVKRIIDKRADDGQLNGSDLTLADLVKVRDTFVTVLDRFFHGRIQYPEAALRSRREENEDGLQGEEAGSDARGEARGEARADARGGEGRGGDARREGRRIARRGTAMPDGTESVLGREREEGGDAGAGGGSTAQARGGDGGAAGGREDRARRA